MRVIRTRWFEASRPCLGLALTVCLAAGLGGCGTVSEKMAGAMGSMPGVGLPANAPERPAEQRAYPAVHDMPPPRTNVVLTGAEQQQVERELMAARDGQKAAAAPPAQPAAAAKPAPKPVQAARQKPPPAPAPRLVPASSSRTIY